MYILNMGVKGLITKFFLYHSVRPTAMIDKGAVHSLACLCDGDARIALNGLQLAVQSRLAMATNTRHNEKPTETTSTSGKAPQQVHDDGNFTSSLHSTPGENQTHTPVKITVSDIKEGLQRTHKMYDRVGEEHYNAISALHKSIRGGDANAALYWLARMLVGGEDPLFIARRLVRCASEDIGTSPRAGRAAEFDRSEAVGEGWVEKFI